MTGARSQTIFYTVAALIALIGLADATYLTVRTSPAKTSSAGSGIALAVLAASMLVAGIPTAASARWLTSLFQLSLAGRFWLHARPDFPDALSVAVMLGVTLWLLYVQAFILHAFCPSACIGPRSRFFSPASLLHSFHTPSQSEGGSSQ